MNYPKGTSQSEKLIQENKIQAQRDLNSANILLKHDGSIENIAFLLEQSVEKLLKSVYCRYNLNRIGKLSKKFMCDTKGHNVDFILRMLKEMYKCFGDEFLNKLYELTDSEKKLSPLYKNLKNFNKLIDQIKQDIKMYKINERQFKKYLSKLEQKKIHMINLDDSVVFKTLEFLNKTSKNNKFRTDLFSNATNKQKWRKHGEFLALVKMLAPYVFPHAITSRYPMNEYRMNNLTWYREDEKQLRSFFLDISKKIQILIKTEKEFNERIETTYNLNKITNNLV